MTLLSDLLGLLIILGSFTVKVPLIRNCIAVKSTAGLPESSIVLQSASFLINISYNARKGFPISTWGEYVSLCGQNLVLLGVIWYFNKAPVTSCLRTTAQLIGLVVYMVLVPKAILPIMPLIGMFVGWSGLVPQIMANFRQKHTGPLSLGAQSFVVLGASTRLYTVLTQVDDWLTQFRVLVGTSLQVIILAQIVTMRENTLVVNEKLRNGESVEEDVSEKTSGFAAITENETFQKMLNANEVEAVRDALHVLKENLLDTWQLVSVELTKLEEQVPVPLLLSDMGTFDVLVDRAYDTFEQYI